MNRADLPHGEKIHVRIITDLAELIPGFLANRRKDVQILINALERQNADAVGTVGHKMRGDGGGYGFYVLTEIGAGLEEAAKERNWAELRRRVTELSTYLDRIEVVYD